VEGLLEWEMKVVRPSMAIPFEFTGYPPPPYGFALVLRTVQEFTLSPFQHGTLQAPPRRGCRSRPWCMVRPSTSRS